MVSHGITMLRHSKYEGLKRELCEWEAASLIAKDAKIKESAKEHEQMNIATL